MSSIYIHIPFCKQRCTYCDFHFVTSIKNEDAMVNSIISEIQQRRKYLSEKKLNSIYLGGGTPSIISTGSIKKIIKKINDIYTLNKNTEITIEVNPDDVNKKKLNDYFNIGINRLSIGIQSFDDEILKSLNRSHNSIQAKKSIEIAINSQIKNISLDIMFNLPNQNLKKLDESLNICFNYGISHLSIYGLTIEPNTVLHKKILEKEINEPCDEMFIKQYNYIIDLCKKKGFTNYEISNFCKEKHESKHNKNYWFGKEYLGIGPSAHSFNGIKRRWNIKNNQIYVRNIDKKEKYFNNETLHKKDFYNEYILKRIRTNLGIDINEIDISYKNYFLNKMKYWVNEKYVVKFKNRYVLKNKGKLICDRITESLFFV